MSGEKPSDAGSPSNGLEAAPEKPLRLWLLGVIAVGFVILFIAIANDDPDGSRISLACHDRYGPGAAADDCINQMTLEKRLKDYRDGDHALRREAGVE